MESIKLFLSTLHFWDYLFFLFLMLVAIRGAFKGFIATVMNAVALVGGLLLSYFFYKPFTPLLKSVGITRGSALVAFLLIFLLFYLLVKVVESFVQKITENDSIDNLNRALGFFLGLVIGIALIFLFVIVVGGFFSNFFNLDLHFEKSLIARWVEKLFDQINPADLFPEGGKHA